MTTTTTIKEQIHIAESRLALYYKAEKAILSGQSYEIEGLKLTRANLKDVQSMINTLESKISRSGQFKVSEVALERFPAVSVPCVARCASFSGVIEVEIHLGVKDTF